MHNKLVSCLICVSQEDLLYLFEYSLISCLEKINFIDNINIVTPNPAPVKEKLLKIDINHNMAINVIPDSELLSKNELQLCGWSKQQIIKMRSCNLCSNDNILSVGADTIILDKLALSQFYNPYKLIVNYRKHDDSTKFEAEFEAERVNNIYKLLGLYEPVNNRKKRDYIFDVFLFKREILKELENYLSKKFGGDCFVKIFPISVSGDKDMVKIGEWSLYTIFAIEILKLDYMFRNGTDLVHQIHTHKEFNSYDYTDKAVHFVRGDFDKDLIFSNIRNYLSYYENNDH